MIPTEVIPTTAKGQEAPSPPSPLFQIAALPSADLPVQQYSLCGSTSTRHSLCGSTGTAVLILRITLLCEWSDFAVVLFASMLLSRHGPRICVRSPLLLFCHSPGRPERARCTDVHAQMKERGLSLNNNVPSTFLQPHADPGQVLGFACASRNLIWIWKLSIIHLEV